MPEPNHILLDDIAFLLPCKAANTSVKWALWWLSHPEDYWRENRYIPSNIHDDKLFRYVSRQEVASSGVYTVGVMRHPENRVISQWNYLKAPNQSFAAWMRRIAQHSDHDADQHERSQLWDLTWNGSLIADVILDVAHLDSDWRALCALKGWRYEPIENTNTLEDNGIKRLLPRELYEDTEARRAYLARFGGDLVFYNEVVPRMRAARLITPEAIIHSRYSRIWDEGVESGC